MILRAAYSHIHKISIASTSTLSNSSSVYLQIGKTRIKRVEAKNPDFVPAYYGLNNQPPRDFLPHLKWLIQKDVLKQDVFLLGVPGKVRLELVMRYLEATNREFEYLSITRDTTEADIKQRREIRDGTAFYTDLCAVRAALAGRVLVIDGVERAERNVLPILNNLLENREMQLDDGRFLMKHDKYDELKQKYNEETLKKMGMERVSENFHVIALGLPVPRFPGNTLDPPFRSRFQCRNIREFSFQTFLEQSKAIAPNVNETELNDLMSLIYAYNSEASSSRPRISIAVVEHCLELWNKNPMYSAGEILDMCYPAKEILSDSEKDLIDKFKTKFELNNKHDARKIVGNKIANDINTVEIEEKSNKLSVDIPVAAHPSVVDFPWIPTVNQETLIADLVIGFSKGDFVLTGGKGSGKSRILNELSKRLNFNYASMVLHKDMNTRELVQRRHMKENGDTFWEDSQLVKAAKSGDVCILDGVEQVHPSVLMSLSQLVYHRRFDLPNGDRLIGHEEFDKICERDGIKDEELNNRGTYKIPKSFRLLFVGESQSKEHKWINENVLSMLPFYSVPKLLISEQMQIIEKMTDGSNMESVNRLAKFVHKIRESHDQGLRNASNSLSLRRLIHITKRDHMQPGHLRELVEKAALSKFLPQLTKQAFSQELTDAGIVDDLSIRPKTEDSYLNLIRASTDKAEDEALIPNVLFHDNQQHISVLEDMARDMKLGSHLLLIGNQGVGKNKITDRFLYLINRPRQYMQLHRDTTVQTLTMQTVVENGIIRHEDSALVKAARNGQILVIDEADKAPLHVIAILKSLLDTGNLALGDGRTLRPLASLSESEKNNSNFVPIHPNFRIIMLANRPGFPFLGNNLFAVLGDLFAIHMIDHPNRSSELEMISKYGPNVSQALLKKLLNIFNELREKTDEGLLQYPYSTRELVNIVKHCNEFPDDPLPEVARNVFDFDSYNEDTVSTIEAVFHKHGVTLGADKYDEQINVAEQMPIGELKSVGKWSFKPIEFAKNFHFSPPEQLELKNIDRVPHSTISLDKTSTRSTVFSEQVVHWKLPNRDNIISDGLRVDDDLFLAAVNPPRIFHMKDFTETEKADEIDISKLLKTTETRRFDSRPSLRLAHLGGDHMLIFDDDSATSYLLEIRGKTAAVVRQEEPPILEKITDLRLYSPSTKRRTPWQMAPPNKNSAIVYKKDANSFRIYSTNDGVPFVQNGEVPFQIKRVFPIGENQWMMVSNENEHYAIRIEDNLIFFEQMEQTVNEKLDAVAMKKIENDFVLISEPYYYLKGKNSSNAQYNVHGKTRILQKNVVDAKRPYYQSEQYANAFVDPSREVTFLGKTIISSKGKWEVPSEALSRQFSVSRVAGFLEAIDTQSRNKCYVPIPAPSGQQFNTDWFAKASKTGFIMVPWSENQVLTVDSMSEIRSYEVSSTSLAKSFNEWKRMTSGEETNLRMEFQKDEDKFDISKLDEPKLGKVDPDNTPHHGGNQWMGGTGGYNTAGLGGVGGPFRLDAGHDVHQMPDSAKQQVPRHILKKAREIAKQEYSKKLKEINMSEYDGEAYESLWRPVEKYSKKLESVVDQLEAKKKEREWEKHQTSGDLDDGKLIEGITGEQNIYRRRLDKEPDPGAPQTKPKRLKVCFDLSGSMYRFNGYDQRLKRSLETALMIMNSLEGKTDKVEYDIVAHSGDSPCVRFVDKKFYPKNNKHKLDVIKQMLAHSQYCVSGDNTVECLEYATKELAKKDEYDEMVVVLISDANFQRYGIRPEELKKEMIKEPNVNSFVIFVGSLEDQAEELLSELPAGKAFILKDTKSLPKIIETIFSSTIAQ